MRQTENFAFVIKLTRAGLFLLSEHGRKAVVEYVELQRLKETQKK